MVEALEKQGVLHTSHSQTESLWKKGGPSLVTICQTTCAISVPPMEVASLVGEKEEAAGALK